MGAFEPVTPPRPRRRRWRGLLSRLANVLTAMLITLAGLAILATGLVFLVPDWLPVDLAVIRAPTATPEGPLPTLQLAAVVPTPTETARPLRGVSPTWTPQPDGIDRAALTPTNTRRPTLTPSITPILPSRTPIPTDTPTPTATPTEGTPPTPTNTRSPFPFTKTIDSPFFLRKFTGTGCAYVAGEVLDVNGNQAAPNSYRVHIWDADGRTNGIDTRLSIGGSPGYGQSGWEQFISNTPEVRVFNLQLETNNGTAVSTPYQVVTSGDCAQNVAYLIFVQNR